MRLAAGLAASVLVLWSALSAAAATVTSDGRVFRYRANPGEAVQLDVDYIRRHFWARASSPVDFGPGCRLGRRGFYDFQPPRESLDVLCPLGTPGGDVAALRYRLSLSDGDDIATGGVAGIDGKLDDIPHHPSQYLRGVIYAGGGDDEIEGTGPVYGAAGNDHVSGLRTYGGPGNDTLYGARGLRLSVLHGGPGNDDVHGGWVYGGPGDDRLYSSGFEADMLVGGPGQDTAFLYGGDPGGGDLVRLRGGGADMLRCLTKDSRDVAFVDRSDHVRHNCKGMQILRSGRPRYLPLAARGRR